MNFQSSEIVLVGATPGLAVGETVGVTIDGGVVMRLPDNEGFSIEVRVVASGVIGGVTNATQGFAQKLSLMNVAGTLTIEGFATAEQFGTGAANSWTFTVGVMGGTDLSVTFTTGATQAAVNLTGSVALLETPLLPPTS